MYSFVGGEVLSVHQLLAVLAGDYDGWGSNVIGVGGVGVNGDCV